MLNYNPIDTIKILCKDFDKNWLPQLESINLHTEFEPIYRLENYTVGELNVMVAYIIYAYDSRSMWIDVRKDRIEDKARVLNGLGIKQNSKLFGILINDEEEVVLQVALNYMLNLRDWKFQTVISHLDYHAKMIRFVNQKTDEEKSIDKINKEGVVKTLTTDYDIDVISKVNKQKGELLQEALKARREADKLIEEIKKDYAVTDKITQTEFDFEFSDPKNYDIMYWSHFIEKRNKKRELQK